MFKIAHQIKKTDDNKLILRVPLFLKIIFLLFSILMLISMFYPAAEEGTRETNYISILLLLIAVFAVFHEEKWIFDKDKKVIEKRTGLMFYFSRTTSDMKELKNIKISEIKKMNQQTSKYHKMSLVFIDDTEKELEIVYFRELDKLIKNGELIASFCGVSLYK
ncbi:MAG: hypothetical protein RBT69_10870 [Spirochaetia bacterium]|jgi:glucan phosphoethanolaminetransferase (alkaline phosphatase superfamily)|nr:hypothetical protein [Spirochaetia bacterium]